MNQKKKKYKQAINYAQRLDGEKYDKFSTLSQTHLLSSTFDNKMKSLFDTKRKKIKNNFRITVATCVLVLLIVFIPSIHFSLKEKTDSSTDFELRAQTMHAYSPVNLPDGFSIYNRIYATDSVIITTFKDSSGNQITLEQGKNISISDPDLSESDKLCVNNKYIQLYTKENFSTLLWEEKGYTFIITGPLDYQKLIEMCNVQ